MTRGNIVLVPFPFDDLSATKVRPAVCLTAPIGPHRHTVVAFVTSRMPDDALESDLTLSDGDADFRATGLKVTSTVRLHRLVTLPTQLFQRQLGHLTEHQWEEAQGRLAALFGWSGQGAEAGDPASTERPAIKPESDSTS